MTRHAQDLADFPDTRLFREISQGIPHILANAADLDETAQRLHQVEKYRSSEVFRGFSKEEAAKVLILIDLVRCPPGRKQKEIVSRFYGHVAKRIYAMTCKYPRIASFGQLRELVESEILPYRLDGPNDVDWIFPNSIKEQRERLLYVDYVREITDDSGDYYWRLPTDLPSIPRRYETPDCLKLGQALLQAGVGSPTVSRSLQTSGGNLNPTRRLVGKSFRA